jgi:CheY-like chemotaxis protein
MADQPALRVLLIDDNPDFITTYRPIFEAKQIPIDVAATGREGLVKIGSFQPTVVICDVMMPDITGKDVLVAIRKNPTTVNLPVIVLSALPADQQRDEFLQLGANEYLEKIAVDPSKLLTMIEALTGLTAPVAPPIA